MVLTYYEYINEGRGISNFIKKLSTIISGKISKELEEISEKDFASFDIKIDANFEEISQIESINIIIKMDRCDYHSKFYLRGDNLLKDILLEFDIPKKSKLDHFYLHELITHELTHLYEYYNIVINQRSFPLYNKVKKSLVRTIKQDDFDIFSYFRNLVYLTLDNELNARVSQTYQLLTFKKIKDKEQLFSALKTTHIWKKFKEVENFNPKKYVSDLIEILGVDLTKILVNGFNEELSNNGIRFKWIKNVEDVEDLIRYFKNWNSRFRYKLKKHLQKLNRVIDEVVKDLE